MLLLCVFIYHATGFSPTGWQRPQISHMTDNGLLPNCLTPINRTGYVIKKTLFYQAHRLIFFSASSRPISCPKGACRGLPFRCVLFLLTPFAVMKNSYLYQHVFVCIIYFFLCISFDAKLHPYSSQYACKLKNLGKKKWENCLRVQNGLAK